MLVVVTGVEVPLPLLKVEPSYRRFARSELSNVALKTKPEGGI
jgi:hypothetical protein